MTDDNNEYVLKGVDLPPMFWSAAGASAIPMALGVLGLFFCYVPTALGRAFFHDYLFSIPVALCFAIGTPLVAWLSCQNLIFKAHEGSRGLFKLHGVWPSALKYSFFVQGFAFLTHVILISVFAGAGALEAFAFSFMIGGMINLVLFVIITMPLSFFCSAIFALLYSGPPEAPIT